jgi:hypothetical protein
VADGAPQTRALESDTSDAEWLGDYDNFEGMSKSGTSSHSSGDSFHEDALRELGYYDEREDLS